MNPRQPVPVPAPDRHALSYLVEFRDRQLEHDYRASAVLRDRWVAMAGVVAGCIVTLGFAAADYTHFGADPGFWTLLSIRAGFGLASVLVLLRLRGESSAHGYELWLTAWLVFMIAVLVYSNALRPVDQLAHVTFDVATLLAIYVVFITRFSMQVLLGLGFSAGYLLTVLGGRLPAPVILRDVVIAIVSTNLFGILLAWRIHHLGRLQFASLQREKALRRELEEIAYRDSLTGIANRREFMRRAEQEMARYRRHEAVFSVILLDLDHFKRLNDRFGHAAGDDFLTAFGDTLVAAAREVDLPARLGGEEFAVLLPDTGMEDAGPMAERILAGTSALRVAGGEGRCTVSAGISAVAPGDRSVEDVLRRADIALYDAKAKGRNRVISLAA